MLLSLVGYLCEGDQKRNVRSAPKALKSSKKQKNGTLIHYLRYNTQYLQYGEKLSFTDVEIVFFIILMNSRTLQM